MKTIGLIGAGHIGSQLARLAVRHGDDVLVSNSRGPETLQELVGELGRRARAGTLDVVDIGPLRDSWRDTPGYGPRRTAEELRRDLAAAQRPVRA
jgi:NAD(P)-dependent dehydrogenase (short-subunit alcohol dehydrogenase family)